MDDNVRGSRLMQQFSENLTKALKKFMKCRCHTRQKLKICQHKWHQPPQLTQVAFYPVKLTFKSKEKKTIEGKGSKIIKTISIEPILLALQTCLLLSRHQPLWAAGPSTPKERTNLQSRTQMPASWALWAAMSLFKMKS